MLTLRRILRDGLIMTLPASAYLLAMLWHNPRLALNDGDYPPDVIQAAPPKTAEEQREAVIWGIPFFVWSILVPLASALALKRESRVRPRYRDLFLHTLGVLNVFNLVDLVVLDWLIFCSITPGFLVIPGTEGFAGYRDYGFHLRGHATKGSVILTASAALIAATAWLTPIGGPELIHELAC